MQAGAHPNHMSETPITIHVSYYHPSDPKRVSVAEPVQMVNGMTPLAVHPIWMLLRGGWNVTWRAERSHQTIPQGGPSAHNQP